MKKYITVLILFLILPTLAPVINVSNKEDLALLETIEVNPDFSELILLKEEIIRLYQTDLEGNQFVDFTPTCVDFIRASNDTYSKIRALNENSKSDDINNINIDTLSENYIKFCVDASEYKANISLSQQIENITKASFGVMEEINSTFSKKVEEMNEIKKRLEVTLAESGAEIISLRKDYTTLQDYSSLLATRNELESTYSAYAKRLRNSMIISLSASTIMGILIGFLISRKWKRRLEYLSLYTRKVKIIHPMVYACTITIVVILLVLVYIYIKNAYSIFSYLIP
jgi:hypothetical protein